MLRAAGRARTSGGAWIGPVVLCVLLTAGTAGASGLEALMRQLRSDPDYKVRLSAALALGRNNDPRAIPALVDGLRDSFPTVRAVSAGALGKLLQDPRVPAKYREQTTEKLRKLSATDTDTMVKSAAASAVEALTAAGGGESSAGRTSPADGIFVHVESFVDASGQMGAPSLSALGDATREALAAEDMLVRWPDGKLPSKKALQKAKTRGAFTLLGTMSDLTVAPQGRRANITCRVKLIVATYPEKAARSFINGSAKMDTANSSDAIERAKARCAQDVIRHLVKKQVVPELQAKSQ